MTSTNRPKELGKKWKKMLKRPGREYGKGRKNRWSSVLAVEAVQRLVSVVDLVQQLV